MAGIVLAGGLGSRLSTVTKVYNKHAALVYDQPMIYYPIKTLIELGETHIIVVSGGENIGDLVSLLGDGEELGISITYRVQTRPMGIAEAIGCCEELQQHLDEVFPVILGDNYFDAELVRPTVPTIYVDLSKFPERFGVYSRTSNRIVEKPKPEQKIGNEVVTGLYYYDHHVFDYVRTLVPSARNELEITDVNNRYLSAGTMDVKRLIGYWMDMGTPSSLLQVANYVAAKSI